MVWFQTSRIMEVNGEIEWEFAVQEDKWTDNSREEGENLNASLVKIDKVS